ncbi:MAG: hypothetical protein E6323_14620 [Clostridium perfringens]|uniref:hypothetical protein n=1 Tax=Clostridium perfringens TaxID=1502 RepID=UPI001158C2B0|nr:hypothetical protein [Clostridium perfringens]MDK0614576.1 hypothetical protein [Clostridium perfringens]MDK0740419.1 hypothetical protein [Clostridium perfringens]MDK0984712.1 hypothetical protein [Clostridium perfringens]MDM0925536.1 hypothetical protein [Clostridium perfringens]MDU7158901.1 hypothetical protein [Clostridium perfringens]
MKKRKSLLLLTGLISCSLIGCGAAASEPLTKNRTVTITEVEEDTDSEESTSNTEDSDIDKKPNNKINKTNGTIVEENFPPNKEGVYLRDDYFLNIDNIYRVKISNENEPTEIRIFFDTNLYINPEAKETSKERIERGEHAQTNKLVSHKESATKIYSIHEDHYSNPDYYIPIPASTDFIKRSTKYIEDKGFQSSMGNGFVLHMDGDDTHLADFYIQESDITNVSLDEYVKIKYNQIIEEYKPTTDFNFTQAVDLYLRYINVEPGENNTLICELEVINTSDKDMTEKNHLLFRYHRPGKAIDFRSNGDINKELNLKAGERKVFKHVIAPVYGDTTPLNPDEIIVTAELQSVRGPKNLVYTEERMARIK